MEINIENVVGISRAKEQEETLEHLKKSPELHDKLAQLLEHVERRKAQANKPSRASTAEATPRSVVTPAMVSDARAMENWKKHSNPNG